VNIPALVAAAAIPIALVGCSSHPSDKGVHTSGGIGGDQVVMQGQVLDDDTGHVGSSPAPVLHVGQGKVLEVTFPKARSFSGAWTDPASVATAKVKDQGKTVAIEGESAGTTTVYVTGSTCTSSACVLTQVVVG
jgi:hypothetical protein